MKATSPEQASQILVELFAAGRVEATAALYEDEAVFAEIDGSVRGIPGVIAAHRRFVDSGSTLQLLDSVVFETDDLALVHWSWAVTLPDGSTLEGVSAEVLRRQPDGAWKFVIDNSDGAALIGAAGG